MLKFDNGNLKDKQTSPRNNGLIINYLILLFTLASNKPNYHPNSILASLCLIFLNKSYRFKLNILSLWQLLLILKFTAPMMPPLLR